MSETILYCLSMSSSTTLSIHLICIVFSFNLTHMCLRETMCRFGPSTHAALRDRSAPHIEFIHPIVRSYMIHSAISMSYAPSCGVLLYQARRWRHQDACALCGVIQRAPLVQTTALPRLWWPAAWISNWPLNGHWSRGDWTEDGVSTAGGFSDLRRVSEWVVYCGAGSGHVRFRVSVWSGLVFQFGPVWDFNGQQVAPSLGGLNMRDSKASRTYSAI